MHDENRGLIINRDRAKQLISFGGLIRRRNISPTDIDFLIDYSGRSFVYGEFKLEGAEEKKGQIKALENLVCSHKKASHLSCAFIVYHNVPIQDDIIPEILLINRVYHDEKWHDWTQKNATVLEFLRRWEEYCEKINNIEL